MVHRPYNGPLPKILQILSYSSPLFDPQIMNGYYTNPEATANAVDRYGLSDAGDLGRINPAMIQVI